MSSAAMNTFPDGPVQLIEPFGPGGGPDLVGRAIARALAHRWGHPVTLQNQPGAGSTVGPALVATSPPDGHTVLVSTSAHAYGAAFALDLQYDPLEDFVPVAPLTKEPYMLVAGSHAGFTNLAELISFASARPGSIRFGSSGVGTATQWIDNDLEPKGNGPHGLADYCNQIRTYWDARADPNVHLFHYTDLWNERESEMRRVATALGVRVAEERWPAFVDAAGLDSMRSRAGDSVPEGNVGLWRSTEQFFRVGGTRNWSSLLDSRDIAHFNERLRDLAGDASDWVIRGRVALEEDSSHTG